MMLTEKQQAILAYIQAHAEEHGYPPSVREIGRHFGIYPGTVQDHISAIERKGFLRKKRFLSRSMSVSTPPGQEKVRSGTPGLIPIVGNVAAGLPLLAAENGSENVEHVQLPPNWAGAGSFLLKVQGDSMVGAHILDGDYVLVQPQQSAENGEIVVALLGEEATVKRFQKTKSGIRLEAENPKFKPIEVPVDDTGSFRVVGRVTGVLRVMKKP